MASVGRATALSSVLASLLAVACGGATDAGAPTSGAPDVEITYDGPPVHARRIGQEPELGIAVVVTAPTGRLELGALEAEGIRAGKAR